MIRIFKTFYCYLFEYKLLFGGFIFVQILATVLFYLNPYIYKLIINNVSLGRYDFVFRVMVLFGVIRIATNLLSTLGSYLGDKVVIPASRNIRVDVFRRIQDLDFAYHSNKNTGSLISAFRRGDSAFFNIFSEVHNDLLDVLVGLTVTLYFFLNLSITISIFLVGIFVLNCIVSIFLIKKNLKARQEFNDQEDGISGIITDNLINYETVKYFAQEQKEEKRLQVKFVSWLFHFFKFANSYRMIDIVIGTLGNIGIVVILVIVLRQLVDGKITTGDFVLVISFLTSFFPMFFRLIYRFRNISKSFVDLEKYFRILYEKELVLDPISPVDIQNIVGDIEFRQVSFSYPDGKKGVVKDINLKIKSGQSVAFAGKSGVGKTTLIRLLLRFYDVSQGEILIDGVNIKEFTKTKLRSFMGLVPQEPILFNNTIGFNICYGKPDAPQVEIVKAAKLANLHKFIYNLPLKYDTQVGERGIKLSGGQKQRLAIARVILANPKIIVFDEATSNLDSESERLIQNALWKIAENRTLIIIAHRFSTIRKANRIVVFDRGRIVDEGTHEDLIKNDQSLYGYLWNLQAKGEIERE